ncbi:MAG: ribosome biogenesis GTPase Der [Gallionella sp.]|nr:ribosome biogenesis GTPase Der [Gallionella sp.]
MLPTLVLVGRPNVGKSTLFNRLTRSRDALVADQPGLTRDRHYGRGRVGSKPYLVVDTGGLEPVAKDGILFEMAKQSRQAVDEADVVMFIVDGRTGCTPQDTLIAGQLRKTGKPILLLVNKAEGMQRAKVTADFFELGLGEPLPISSAHGDNVNEVVEIALENFSQESEEDVREDQPKLAIVGRPNVGKSTLVNAILGEQRVIAFDQPGTTRDSIYIDFERDGKQYTIIDTAGVRRRGKIDEAVEKFSVIKTMQAIEDANVVVLVVDGADQITEQDAHVADFVLQAGRALVLAVNKWDGLDAHQRDTVKRDIERKLHFLGFAKMHYISALNGSGVDKVLKSVDEAYTAAMIKLSTPKLTRALLTALEKQQPPKGSRFRPKMRYAHQGGSNPPLIVIHGSGLDDVPASYQRYLERAFCEMFKLQGTPLKIQFNSSKNPFEGKKRVLTEEEQRRAHRARIVGRKRYG